MKISQAKRKRMNRCVSPLKQEEAWGSWETVRNECNWCMVNNGERRQWRLQMVTGPEFFRQVIVRQLTPL